MDKHLSSKSNPECDRPDRPAGLPYEPRIIGRQSCISHPLGLPFAAMRYRRFGRTELAMPVISCGGMRYQFKWQDALATEIPAENQANLEACIHRALQLGINHLETARG